MGHGALEPSAHPTGRQMGSQGGGGFCSHHLWNGRGSRTCFLVTRQEDGIRQTQKVLETQSACMSLIPKGNFSEKGVGGGRSSRRKSLCFRFGL